MPTKMADFKSKNNGKLQVSNISKDVEKLETLCITSENIKWVVTVENSLRVPHKVKHRIAI